MKKRLLSLILTMALLCAMLPQIALFASAQTYSGTCGTNLSWSYNSSTGALTITGSGAMTNWSNTSYVPWSSYRSFIKSVSLPDRLTSIGDDAFYDCSSLTSITIPDSVTSIGYAAFYRCSSLTSMTIPDSVTSIGIYAFYDCSSLTSITIPDSVTRIGGYAFCYCSSLTSITIPDSVTSIGGYAFDSCSSLTSITVDENNPSYSGDASGVLFNKDKTELICCPGRYTGGYTIPDSVTSIGYAAFGHCSSLTSVTIPTSVTSIGYAAFRDCRSLTSITIPDSVTSIGGSAFGWCSSLTSVTISDSVTSIGNWAFFACSRLTSITVQNPSCTIYSGKNTLGVPGTTTIYGYEGSTAQSYAEEYGYSFKLLNETLAVRNGYNLKTDSYCFDNINETISLGIYQNAFGLWSGKKLYRKHEDQKPHGHCFGMAVTTAWLLNYPGRVSNYLLSGDRSAKYINDIQEGSTSSFFSETAKTIIKYAQIFQHSDICRKSGADDFSGLINAVKNSIYYGGGFVTIIIKQTGQDKHAHAVLAVGLRETATDYYILINDSNWLTINPPDKAFQEMRISKDYSSWQYSVKEIIDYGATWYDYNSSNAHFSYTICSDDIERLAIALHDKNNSPWKYYFSTAAQLLGSSVALTESSNIRFIQEPSYGTTNNEQSNYLYWADVDRTLTIPANTDNQMIYLCDEDSGIEVSIDNGSTAIFQNGSNDIQIKNSLKSDNVDISFLSTTADGKLRKTTISGKPATNEIVGKKRNSEIIISGIEGLNINYTDGDNIVISHSNVNIESGETAIISVNNDKTIHVQTREDSDCGGNKSICPSAKFTDVAPFGDWSHNGIDFCLDRGLFGGTSATTFEPETAMNRAMLVTVLWRYEGSPKGYSNDFRDVVNGEWYADAVSWAAANGIVNGIEKGRFDPDGIVTREQMATILYRYSDWKGFDTSKRADFSSFPDAGKVGSWAKTAMQWAVAEGLIGGSKEGGKSYILPSDGATRAQVATILMRFVQNIAEK